MADRPIYQVEFPDTKLQVAAEGVEQDVAARVMIEMMTSFILSNIELIEPQVVIPEGVTASFGKIDEQDFEHPDLGTFAIRESQADVSQEVDETEE